MKIFEHLDQFFSFNKNDSPTVHLKYFQKYPNSGDVFSRVVASHYFSKNIIPVRNIPCEEPNLILLGSILHWADANSIICGAGFMFSNDRLKEMPRSIVCVRGPLTAAILDKQGVSLQKKYADPGVLAPAFFPDSSKIKYKIGIIPHRKDASNAWLKTNRKKEILVIDVLSPLKKYFSQLQQCELILSSSLHGIIFAHAYGKPALWVELSDKVQGNGFKFYDYYQSIGISPDKVRRIKIHEKTNPDEISKLADFADQSIMREIMEESLEKTKTILFEDNH